MKNLSTAEIRLYFTMLITGIIVGNSTMGLPIMLETKGLSNADLAGIIGISLLGAVVQPLVGAISDNVKHRKILITCFGLMLTISMLILFVSTSVISLKIAVFFSAVAAQSTYIIFDSIVVIVSHEKKYNYALIRSGMSLGFGLSIISSLPLVYYYDTSAMIVVTALFGITIAILALRIDDSACQKAEVKYITEMKSMSKNKLFLLMLVISVILSSTNAIKLSYQTSKLTDLNTSALAIAIISFVIIIPEMILMPKYDKFFGKWSFVKIYLVATIIFLVNILVLGLTSSPIVIFLVAPLHGLASTLYIPKYAYAFRALLSQKVLSTAFMLRSTLSAVFSFLLSILILESLYDNYGASEVMYALFAILALDIIFIMIMDKTCRKNNVTI